MQFIYVDRRTWLHNVPAAHKLLLVAVWGGTFIFIDSAAVLALASAASGGILLSLRPMGQGAARIVRGILFASALVLAFHVAMGQALWGLAHGARFLSVAMLGMALTLTTRHGDVLDVFERLLAPLARVGVRGDRVGLQLALMIRFTELFFVQWKRLDDAHRVRTGSPGSLRLLAPLTIQMLLGARRVGDAVQVRLHE